MQIIQQLNDFIYTIFPSVDKGDIEALKSEIEQFYYLSDSTPKIEIEGGAILVSFDETPGSFKEQMYKKAIAFCELGDFKSAKPILEKLIDAKPALSEYHRNLGQIYSVKGEQKEAIDYLIDAFRWISENTHILLMMGNVFARFKDNINKALTYYEQCLAVNPDYFITLNNIGANLLKKGNASEAIKYLERALEVNETYPNSYHALGLIYEQQQGLQKAFN
ncbi:MAG: tetratricopeptide repeat protein [Balneolales bacterium]|nr:tetratricopeptide repeat protein [Balneolales bacterium]